MAVRFEGTEEGGLRLARDVVGYIPEDADNINAPDLRAVLDRIDAARRAKP